MEMICDTCKHKDRTWDDPICDSCCGGNSHYERIRTTLMNNNAWLKSNYTFGRRLLHPIKELRRIFRNFKFCKQRIKRGWSDADTWDIDMWFLDVMPGMLTRLAENTNSHPNNFTYEQWQRYLKEMARCFSRAASGKIDKEIRNIYLKDGIKMFNEHFWDLWD